MKTLPEILNSWGQVGVEAIKKDLTTVQATGKTVNSVRYEVKHEGTVDRLSFYAREYTSLLEKGRGPTTKNPSPEMIQNLTEYAKARGFQNPKSAAWAIAKKMNKEGDRTYKRGGKIVYSNSIDKLIVDIKKDVTKNFTTKFMQTIKGSFAVLLLIIFASCGSVQTINGVRVKNPKVNQHSNVFKGAIIFGAGYYLSDTYIKKKWQ